jgi:hypothetical protein
MYTDLYLKFSDEAQANEALYTEVPTAWDEEGEPTAWEPRANYQNIDVLGILYENQPIPDPENPPTPIPLDGWHVNVRVVDGEDAEALEDYSIQPTLPRRVWG